MKPPTSTGVFSIEVQIISGKKRQQSYFLDLKDNLYWIVPQNMNHTTCLNKSIVQADC